MCACTVGIGRLQSAVAATAFRQQHVHIRHSRPSMPSQQQLCAVQSSTSLMQQQQRPRQSVQVKAGPVDAAPVWTLDQIAGLAFGAVMLAFYFGSKQVDVFIAKQQRRQLGLCEACGGLYEPASCSRSDCPMKSKSM